jgi:serine/tyrosine/threonine adenylyltransferase
MPVALADLKFEHTTLECFPVDPNERNEVRPSIPGVAFSLVALQPLEDPKVVCTSDSAFALLNVQVEETDAEVAQFLSASKAFSNSRAYAHCYCGYQFGFFAGAQPQALTLGQVSSCDAVILSRYTRCATTASG